MTRPFRHACAIAALIVGALPVGALAQDNPGEGKTVRMARATWDTGWFHGEVYGQLLEELGFTVEGPLTLDNPAFYQSVALGDVDLWVDGDIPLHNPYLPTIEGSAEFVGAVIKAGALQGYLVDKAAAEEFNIRTLDDFKRDEVKAAFDRNGDGMADLVACPPGWGCEILIDQHLDAYDLRDHVNPIKAGYPAAMADAIGAYSNGEHILFYTWTPNWTLAELKPGEDVMWIEVPSETIEGANLPDAPSIDGVEGCVADPCKVGFTPGDIAPVANTAFLEENPAVRVLLEQASIPLADSMAQNLAMRNGDDDIERQAAEWIEKNRATVDQWLQAARNSVD
ncbi:glycine betaine/L-proline ABC transporter substrate-binding protein ProX [Phaeovulum sp. NW3]|uniref:glycine betaine/L-proline ABC transporter substrate-binding protein ProX n=1 Tax=Phaeovulum sp. NW3 TaxID=2934933 RepID=UPI002020E88C|nr:glycine betaine/L-proline ABC transporter substrate-binding protein ProX [Phaeovulum sp. NW3]MCL7466617.1 glycine betaine/L-proline ABC transporter substrate-binding protein ProX [Phaeovulum sp. NW3]